MDMDIRTPYETTWFRNLRVPELCGMFVTPNTEAYGTHILKKFTQSRFPATCEVSYSRIKTMDQHRYEVWYIDKHFSVLLNYMYVVCLSH